MGDFSIPIDVFVSDREGMRDQLQAVQKISVNPGWATSKHRLTLQATADSLSTVTDRFILLQTSPQHPFQVTEATIKRDDVLIDLQEIGSEDHPEDFVVGKGDTRWKATPRYRVRVTVPNTAIATRETAQLALKLSHGLTRVVLDVELVPAARSLYVTPANLYLDDDATTSAREFVVSTDGSPDSLKITPPAGVAIVSTTQLGAKLLKINLLVDHAIWKGASITIADEAGNQQSVVLRRAR